MTITIDHRHTEKFNASFLSLGRWLVLGFIFLLLSGCSREILLRELVERDANEIVSVLSTNGITAKKVNDAKGKYFSVEVRQDDFSRAVAVLRALGLPKSPRANLNDIFRSTGFAPTPFEERVRFLFGLAQEIERTISLMDGVLQTRVHVVTPDVSSKLIDLQQSKASIFVSYDDRFDIELLIPRIRKLVSDSIEGLTPSRVEILAIPSRVDLRQINEVPVTDFLGVRIYHSDFSLFLMEIGLLIGMLCIACYPHLLSLIKWRKSLKNTDDTHSETGTQAS